jgi:methionyl-tRNA formyltransferase
MSSSVNKLTIYGMTRKCLAVLEILIDRFPGVVDTVVVSSDKGNAGDFVDEIIELCKKNDIRIYNRTESFMLRTKYVLAISWRWLIKAQEMKLIVFHDSILPRYRGFNPLPTALINGDNEIGVTALYATNEYDKGDIIAQSITKIQYPIKICDAIEKISTNYQELAVLVATDIINGIVPSAIPQNEDIATYSLWRDDEDYFIDWSLPASQIKRFVDAVGFPYRGAASTIQGKTVRILDATVIDDVCVENRTPGKVLFIKDANPIVVCGEALLRIDTLVDDSGRSLLPLTSFRTRFKGVDSMNHKE